jgi:hypothetical protein
VWLALLSSIIIYSLSPYGIFMILSEHCFLSLSYPVFLKRSKTGVFPTKFLFDIPDQHASKCTANLDITLKS